MFFACAAAGAFMTIWGLLNDTSNFRSFVVYKLIPVALGVWCLFEVAREMI